MLIQLHDVLTPEQVSDARRKLETADWVDGRVTAGHQSVRVKHNLQLPEGDAVAEEIGDGILTALQRHSLFLSAALPLRILLTVAIQVGLMTYVVMPRLTPRIARFIYPSIPTL